MQDSAVRDSNARHLSLVHKNATGANATPITISKAKQSKENIAKRVSGQSEALVSTAMYKPFLRRAESSG